MEIIITFVLFCFAIFILNASSKRDYEAKFIMMGYGIKPQYLTAEQKKRKQDFINEVEKELREKLVSLNKY